MGLEVICVVANAGICRENTYAVRDYCRVTHITFATRIFEPMMYDVDNKLIGSVPGFHLYKDGVYQRSFGLNDDINDVLSTPKYGLSAWLCTLLNGFCWRCMEKPKWGKV